MYLCRKALRSFRSMRPLESRAACFVPVSSGPIGSHSARSLIDSDRAMQPDYLCILDFEATCDSRGFDISQQEIIEFPTLLFNLHTNSVEAIFHEYVRPTLNPRLSSFCTELTGIRQSTVDDADTFPPVWNRFSKFIEMNLMDKSLRFVFLTCGNWDLKTMLPLQLRHSSRPGAYWEVPATLPSWAQWINIKTAFAQYYGPARPSGMLQMLDKLGIPLQGRHHSGIDDCQNIARIVKRMREDGWEL